MFGVIYYIFAVFIYIISIPFLIFSCFRQKYRYSIPQRFFLKNFSLSFSPSFWFHACSYGEIKSLEPILEAMPKQPILITTITQTGYNLAKNTYKNYDNIEVKFLPFEIFIPFWRSRLKSLQTLIVTEAELWYMLFSTAKSTGAKTMLINSRISSRSFPKYKKLSWLYKKIFQKIDETFTQSLDDSNRIKELGAKDIQTFGNLKLFNIPKVTEEYPKSSKITFIASSTHPMEEDLILRAFLTLRKTENCYLIIAPRHPERFEQVKEIIEKNLANTPYTYKIFSQAKVDDKCDVLLIDTLGELNNLYKISDVVILGGSFVKIGGHNPIEPAFFGNKLISGPYIFNQNSLFDAIDGYQIIKKEELTSVLLNHQILPHTSIKDKSNKLKNLINAIISTTQG